MLSNDGVNYTAIKAIAICVTYGTTFFQYGQKFSQNKIDTPPRKMVLQYIVGSFVSGVDGFAPK
ncbi:hypothetical protein [Moorella sp. E308F]|uniref:hypothetical protein n=1 Tax=Moorella sp. E308F TaxID=2572682 RepID=UPI00155AE61A|nr:hypothetical protein [Moorella sp. E308F]